MGPPETPAPRMSSPVAGDNGDKLPRFQSITDYHAYYARSRREAPVAPAPPTEDSVFREAGAACVLTAIRRRFGPGQPPGR